uniref:Cystatin domain-containing protein n=1 Tax=Oreochromis niloticus TaxID=8128 RepID=A0A669D6K9_ORENI
MTIKFTLTSAASRRTEGSRVDGGCNVKLQLDLRETKCHTTNPKPFEDCELRRETQRAVKANCTVLMTIKDGDATITKYECDTRQVNTNSEMVRICPDCPVLLPLNDSEGLKSVHEATTEFNKNTSNQHYYVLKEVGRISSGVQRILFFLPVFSWWPPSTCLRPWSWPPPHAHDHGHGPPPHAGKGGRPPHSHGGPPPHAHDHGHGPPPHAGKGGRPPHSHGGPPPHAHDHGHGPPPHDHEHGHGPPPPGGKSKGSFHPLRRFHPCHRFLVNPDPALHPICPWPLPHRTHN